ncbi:MAG: hypothetical protein SVY41_03530 [Candidatus Nanohaloarchaea archaeon]|nr:hypothetical protein [Candidatus Nanohaloarchaea archaeon]
MAVTSLRDTLVDGAQRVADRISRYRDREILQYVDELADAPVEAVDIQVYPDPYLRTGSSVPPNQYCVAVSPEDGPSYRRCVQPRPWTPSTSIEAESEPASLQSRAEHRARRLASRLEDAGIEATLDVLEPDEAGHDLKTSL